MHTLEKTFPRWREYFIHESSPGWDQLSMRLQKESANYVASQYDSAHPPGTIVSTSLPSGTYRCENLEEQTFDDATFDLVVTQDVFEHIMNPDQAIREIARTLKVGGAFIATVPIVRKLRPSQRRSRLYDGSIVHLLDPEYHGSPVGKGGSLVTIDWGYDIVSYLQHHSQLSFLLCQIDNIDLGIRADLNDVIIGLKQPAPAI
jgi:SAM-dependent methyltransferase